MLPMTPDYMAELAMYETARVARESMAVCVEIPNGAFWHGWTLNHGNACLYAESIAGAQVASSEAVTIDGMDCVNVTMSTGDVVTVWTEAGALYGEY